MEMTEFHEDLKESFERGSSVQLPGSEVSFITNSMETTPLPAKLLEDLASGALRIPDGYYGALALVVPCDGTTGQSQAFAVCREPPAKDGEEEQEQYVLPMALMSIVLSIVSTLNMMMLMPWLLRLVAPKMAYAVMSLAESVEKDVHQLREDCLRVEGNA
jgi:hypothetical protein